MSDYDIQASQIERIRIRCTTVTKLHVGWDYEPAGITSAQMNLFYCLSVMALDGEVFVDQFTEEKIRDPKMLEFMNKIEVVPDPELDNLGQSFRHAIVCEVETKQKKSFTRRIDFAKGGTSNPLTRSEVENKFRKLTAKVLPAGKIEKLYQVIQEIENVASLNDLVDCLTP